MNRLLLLACLLLPLPVHADAAIDGLLQLLDYVGVDYPGAVVDGEVVDAGEYAEMRDFAAAVADRLEGLDYSPARAGLIASARELVALVERRGAASGVAAMTTAMRRGIATHYDAVTVPGRAPDLRAGAALYRAQCAGCHGAEGRGDGPAAAGLEPAPTAFSDRERHGRRSVHGLYATITLGVEGTAMPAFAALRDHQRWDLAFHVADLGATAAEREQGAANWTAASGHPLATLRALAETTPEEAERDHGRSGRALLAHLRAHPELLFAAAATPLEITRAKLRESLAAYRDGDREAAYRLGVAAYLDGFELAEPALANVAPARLERLEAELAAWREALHGETTAQLEQRLAGLDDELAAAQEALDSSTLSDVAAFAGALVILLREGLEALLVIAAIAAFLVRSGRRDAMRYLHIGWIAALAAGGVTWWLSLAVWEIGGATRELTEALAALVAAAVLFWVGFWLHGWSRAARWNRFIEQRVGRALGGATLWSLAGLSFLTVYREAFETILFYQALWAQVGAGGRGPLLSGLGVAAVLLALLGWLILRYSRRLPLRQFFAATGALVFVLAVVFAGKGIAALQEAGRLQASAVDFPKLELLGIYPNLEGLLLQAVMLLAVTAYLLAGRRPVRGHG